MRLRRFIVLLSAIADLTLIGAIVIASGLTPGALPVPHRLLAAPIERRVQLPDIPLPTAPRTPATHPPAQDSNAAPLQAPEHIPTTEPASRPSADAVSAVSSIDTGFEAGFGTVIGDSLTATPAPVALPPVVTAPERLHAGIDAPRKLRDVVPVYPAAARALRTQGLVILEVTINESGTVVDAKVLRSLPGLDQAALDAVTRWTFAPARLNGQAIPVVMTVTINFTLTP